MPDENNYPTDEELETIENWPWDAGYRPLMEFVRSVWWCPDWGWHQKGRTYRISTGGWSGNEEIVGAMQANHQFWSQSWRTARVGGHYRLIIPKVVYEPQPRPEVSP
jgi:hypothetical protein